MSAPGPSGPLVIFFVWGSFLILTFSVDPDEVPYYATLHLGLNCLYMWPFGGLL